jgi:hypothetical protein
LSYKKKKKRKEEEEEEVSERKQKDNAFGGEFYKHSLNSTCP